MPNDGLNRTDVIRVLIDDLLLDGQGLPVKVISGGGGGIGGDASAANQATEIAKLTSIDGKLPAALGGAGGLKVEVVASTGGGLTDAELRATPVPVSGPLTDAQLRAVAVPVSAASLPLPTGAATEATLALHATSAKQDTGNASLTSIDGKLATLGQKTMVGSEPVVIASDQSAIPVSGPLTDTQLRAAPVPISGTVTITDGAGPVTVDGTVAVSSSALPTGAATDAELALILTELGQKLEPADIATLATSAKQDTGNTSLASILAALALLTLAQGADGAATQGPMTQALADDAPPQRITGMVYPLSLTADGRLRVAAAQSHADHDFWGEMEVDYPGHQNDFWRSTPVYYSY